MIRSILLLVALACFVCACSEDEPPPANSPPIEPIPAEKELVPPPVLDPETAPEAPEPTQPGDFVSDAKADAKKPAEKPEVDMKDAALEADTTTVLITQLGSDEAGKRFAAAVELGKLGRTEAVNALINVLETDEDTFVRRAAARSLGELGDEGAIPALIDALEDKEVFVTMSVMQALGRITGESFKTAGEWKEWEEKNPR